MNLENDPSRWPTRPPHFWLGASDWGRESVGSLVVLALLALILGFLGWGAAVAFLAVFLSARYLRQRWVYRRYLALATKGRVPPPS